MNKAIKTILAFGIGTLLVGAIGACTKPADDRAGITSTEQGDHSKMGHSEVGHAEMGHSKMGSGAQKGDTGQATAVVISISPDGQEITLDHSDILGIGMHAMTMGFTVPSQVDISGFKAGDPVSFSVKKDADGGYSITAICNPAVSGEHCLDGN